MNKIMSSLCYAWDQHFIALCLAGTAAIMVFTFGVMEVFA